MTSTSKNVYVDKLDDIVDDVMYIIKQTKQSLLM